MIKWIHVSHVEREDEQFEHHEVIKSKGLAFAELKWKVGELPHLTY